MYEISSCLRYSEDLYKSVTSMILIELLLAQNFRRWKLLQWHSITIFNIAMLSPRFIRAKDSFVIRFYEIVEIHLSLKFTSWKLNSILSEEFSCQLYFDVYVSYWMCNNAQFLNFNKFEDVELSLSNALIWIKMYEQLNFKLHTFM